MWLRTIWLFFHAHQLKLLLFWKTHVIVVCFFFHWRQTTFTRLFTFEKQLVDRNHAISCLKMRFSDSTKRNSKISLFFFHPLNILVSNNQDSVVKINDTLAENHDLPWDFDLTFEFTFYLLSTQTCAGVFYKCCNTSGPLGRVCPINLFLVYIDFFTTGLETKSFTKGMMVINSM